MNPSKSMLTLTSFVLIALLCLPSLSSCAPARGRRGVHLNEIQLPSGFQIDIYADTVENARSMALGDKGTLFVSTRKAGKVYAIVDQNRDNKADEILTLAMNLNMPNGVAFREGSLYVAEVTRVLRFDHIEGRLKNPPKPSIVRDDFPTDRHHGWKFIRFGPDGNLYIPIGAPCNFANRKINATQLY
jgi:glucose/arabinose dehydrogenase